MADTCCELGAKHLLDGQQIVIGGGFNDAQKSMVITSGHCENLVALKTDHEDTILLLHPSREHNIIVVQSPDTDVLVLCTAHYSKLQCLEL